MRVAGNHFVLGVVQLHHTRTDIGILKVQRYCLENILAEYFPSLRFRENGMAKRAGTIASSLSVANLED